MKTHPIVIREMADLADKIENLAEAEGFTLKGTVTIGTRYTDSTDPEMKVKFSTSADDGMRYQVTEVTEVS